MNLSCILPLRPKRYAKILHRLDGHYENTDNRLAPEEIAILGIPDRTVVRELVTEPVGFSTDCHFLRPLSAPPVLRGEPHLFEQRGFGLLRGV